MAVNDGIFPVPVAANPILVLLHVQLKSVFKTVDIKVTAAVFSDSHNT